MSMRISIDSSIHPEGLIASGVETGGKYSIVELPTVCSLASHYPHHETITSSTTYLSLILPDDAVHLVYVVDGAEVDTDSEVCRTRTN